MHTTSIESLQLLQLHLFTSVATLTLIQFLWKLDLVEFNSKIDGAVVYFIDFIFWLFFVFSWCELSYLRYSGSSGCRIIDVKTLIGYFSVTYLLFSPSDIFIRWRWRRRRRCVTGDDDVLPAESAGIGGCRIGWKADRLPANWNGISSISSIWNNWFPLQWCGRVSRITQRNPAQCHIDLW